MSGSTYPTIFKIAIDYLPIQASAVPCERAFSSSAETDTKKRNRINPGLMEALQMLKFALKKQRPLDFMKGWATSEDEMKDNGDRDDTDFLNIIVSKDADAGNVIAQVLAICSEDDTVLD